MARPHRLAIACVFSGVICLLAGLALGRLWPWPAAESPWRLAPDAAIGPPVTFADVVAKVGPGVVTVRARPGETGADRVVQGNQGGDRTGSGFVVDARGLVVTSRHVLGPGGSIEVLVPARGAYAADLVGEDAGADLALLRLADPPPDLTALELGRSEDLRAGDWIVTVGNPFGFAQSVTAGVVSFVGRHLPHSDYAITTDFLQFSAPVNPGSSGCPVIDLRGRVVGVTTQAAAEAQGISFAVPSRTVGWSLDAMARSPDGRVHRGYLGIEFASRRPAERGQRSAGAVIVRVAPGEPAHRAGLRAGDVVLAVDGDGIDGAEALHERIVRGEPGARIALQVLREGRVQDPIEAVLGEVGGKRPPNPVN